VLTRSKGLPPGKPLRRKTPLRSRAAGMFGPGSSLKRAQPRHAKRTPQGFPEAIRKAAIERDHGHCIACGDDRALHVHHRRIKGMGGDARSHTDCLCNAVTLCHLCHLWAHAQRRESEAQGFVVPRGTKLPGSVAVMVHGAGGGGSALFPGCDGQWSSAPGETAA
jgi:hypothetical protein